MVQLVYVFKYIYTGAPKHCMCSMFQGSESSLAQTKTFKKVITKVTIFIAETESSCRQKFHGIAVHREVIGRFHSGFGRFTPLTPSHDHPRYENC